MTDGKCESEMKISGVEKTKERKERGRRGGGERGVRVHYVALPLPHHAITHTWPTTLSLVPGNLLKSHTPLIRATVIFWSATASSLVPQCSPRVSH
ncbi:hypothetical protein E2C01_099644 [Portunus trituberculatus]|uniref:Uncharacterized protein n=1 Tax=Portunus trituberculatus TaxID=210409 RepID=A0A5B7K4C7_PORTR|nr:hypothetical protein [Portunus trituberculatus]